VDGKVWLMDVALREDQIRLSVHGLRKIAERALASAFSAQLKAVVDALRVSDRYENGRARYDYAIAALETGSAVAVLSKVPVSRKSGHDPIHSFGSVMDGVSKEDSASVASHKIVLPYVGRITSGAGRKFSHSVLEIPQFQPFRVDQFMAGQLSRLAQQAANDSDEKFRGIAIGSFDGVIEEVDIRGIIPQVKLTLSAGHKEIDWIWMDCCRSRKNFR
jgi:hypothetical protein